MNPTDIARVFLGWSRPALETVSEHLIDLADEDASLVGVVVVLPGRRAARSLLGALARAAQHRGLPLATPVMITPGEIGHALLRIPGAPAGPMARHAAWIEALAGAPEDARRALAASPPDAADLEAWGRYARVVARTHDDLAARLLRFRDLPKALDDAARTLDRPVPDTPDADRWHAAAAVQERYENLLAERSLHDPGLALMDALERGTAPHAERLVLACVPTLSHAARAAILHADIDTASLVRAPHDLADRFDPFGCAGLDAWHDAEIAIPDDALLFADGPADQAERAFEAIARIQPPPAAADIAIGVPDDTLKPYLARAAARFAGATVHHAAGIPIERTRPVRLLRACARYADRANFDAFAALVRHPDVEPIVAARAKLPEDWLASLDEYQAKSIHVRLDGPWREPEGAERHRHVLDDAMNLLHGLIGPLRPGEPARPPEQWAEPVRDLLRSVYARLELSRDNPRDQPLVRALREVGEAVAELESLVREPCAPGVALRLIVETLSGRAVAEPPAPDAIELLGWLELAFDPAPACVITGLHEGALPELPGDDPLLAPSVRALLALPGDAERLARDGYLLAAELASDRQTFLVAGRKGAGGDPLTPSRLLFREDDESIARRVRQMTGAEPEPTPRRTLRPRLAPGDAAGFATMPIVPAEPVTAMRVTWFKTWLASPYLFYLRHVLRLKELTDDADEIDPLGFGNLLHEAIADFAESPHRDSTDPDEIQHACLHALDTTASLWYGADPETAVRVQLDMARRRLRAFAAWQAQTRAKGWRILHHEWDPAAEPALDVDGVPMPIRGRIDRIDVHDDGSHWRILDYKTPGSSRSLKPTTAHRQAGAWTDLQLPLYRHLAAELNLPGEPDLGYVVLGADVESSPGNRLQCADWTSDDLADADACAREVVRAVREGRFSELGDNPPRHGVEAALSGVGFIDAGGHA